MLDSVSQLLLGLICVCLVACAFTFESREQRATFLSPLVFLVSLFVFAYGIRGILTFNEAGRYGVFVEYFKADSLSTFLAAFGLFVVGTASLICGYASRFYRIIDPVLPTLRMVSVRRVYWVSISLLIIGILAFVSLLPELLRAGAVLGLFERSSRFAVTSAWQGRGQFLFLIMQGTFLILCLLFAIQMKGVVTGRVLLAMSFAVILAASYAFIGSRQGLLGEALALLLFFHYRVRRVPLSFQVMLGMAAVIGGGILGLILDLHLGWGEGDEGVGFIEAFVRFGATFDQFEMLSAYIQKSEEFFFGLPIIEDVLMTYLPRSVFPFKPDIYGTVRLQDALFPHLYDYAGISATYPIGFFGEAYANLHVAGIVLFPFLFGVLLRALINRVATEDRESMYIVVLIGLLSTGPGLVRSYGGSVLAVILTITMLKILFCLPLKIRPKE